MTGLRVPIVVVIVGRGRDRAARWRSGCGDEVLALENAVYSVISPEGCAAILWRSADAAPLAAAAMRMTAAEQQELGIVDGVIDEPIDGAHTDPATTAADQACGDRRAGPPRAPGPGRPARPPL